MSTVVHIKEKLLTRSEFREQVFARDKHTCVFCSAPAVDAHHIIERRLWGDSGGYYLSNGASVCEQHHLECEATILSVEQVRERCGITTVVLPDHFYYDTRYDKWGNIILEDGRRLPGELFLDDSVQKVIAPVVHEFVKYVKYPRTHHLPWSPGVTDDDRVLKSTEQFDGQVVIVTEKMDGECTTMYNDYTHARSVTSGGHPSRDWLRAFHGLISHNIPEGWRINVENVYAKHSIKYTNLTTYALGFAIWDHTNHILDWTTTLDWFELIGITPAPVLYWGVYDQAKIDQAVAEIKSQREIEGYVMRLDKKFPMRDFNTCVGKYVRAGHVQTVKHWMYGQRVEPNELRPGLTGFEQVIY